MSEPHVGDTIAGAVLAGGASRRMGTDKATLEVGGRRMLDRVLAAVSAAGCRPLAVVGGDADLVSSLSFAVPVRHVPDRHPGEGPLGALLTAFDALDAAHAVLMLPCDVPLVNEDALGALVASWRSGAEPGAVVARTDRLEPMCAIWSRRARDVAAEAFETGERSLHRVLARLDSVEVPVAAEGLRNVNTPADLDEARRVGSTPVNRRSGG